MTATLSSEGGPSDESAQPAGQPEQAPPAGMDEGGSGSGSGSGDGPGERSGRRRLLDPAMPTDRLFGWLGPLAVTLLAAILRFDKLTQPAAIVGGKVTYTFDEVYYTKDAHDLLAFGVERGDRCVGPGFVVHPPLGKWLMAVSEWLFGYIRCDGTAYRDPALGWRFASAVVGTLAVLILARTARRMFRSTMLGCFAGLIFALDGLEFVHSRIGILDIFLLFWTVAALGCLVADRDWLRTALATGAPGRAVLWRPWRIGCGLCLGAALATKWSGGYSVVAFAALALAWDVGARRSAGGRPLLSWASRDLPAWAAAFLVLPFVVYTASWTGWFVTDTGYDRAGRSGITGVLKGWWAYHGDIRRFHDSLTTNHPYESNNPFAWLILHRPVAFSYTGSEVGQNGCTSPGGCSSEVLDLGNPAVWWIGTLALIAMIGLWLVRRDWRAALVLVGFALNFAPWLLFPGRTKFIFYALPLLPFIVLALTAVAALVLGPPGNRPNRRISGALVVGLYALVVLGLFAFFHPIWVGDTIPTSAWDARIWFQKWI
ncbi:MAG: dolichyl-phosphate-mannose-protein mannosyltransferase [Frankiaceae bacterium]|nr:dolichyl-phosphate-mannose-protein mannosyltransferase [Frankiaceae bacterium]